MSTEDFVVRIADLDVGPWHLRQPIGTEWLARALADTDGEPWASTGSETAGELDLTVSKNGRQILVRGHVRARITLPCARTLDPAHYELEPEVFLLLEPSAEEPTQGRGRSEGPARGRTQRDATQRDKFSPDARNASRDRQAGKGPAGRERGKSGKAAEGISAPSKKGKRRGGDWSEDPELTDEAAALDTYAGDYLHLDGFIREFIVLEFPMFPLREDLRSDTARASSALPSEPGASPGVSDAGPSDAGPSGARGNGAGATQLDGEKPVDPRLSPLAELKARLEKKE